MSLSSMEHLIKKNQMSRFKLLVCTLSWQNIFYASYKNMTKSRISSTCTINYKSTWLFFTAHIRAYFVMKYHTHLVYIHPYVRAIYCQIVLKQKKLIFFNALGSIEPKRKKIHSLLKYDNYIIVLLPLRNLVCH